MGDVLTTCAGQPGYLGTAEPTSLAAEQAALMWAILWALQLPGEFHAHCTFCFLFDNTTAGYGASGASGLSEESALAPKLRGLVQYLQACAGSDLQFQHVASHDGHPWNELVDVCAKTLCGARPKNGVTIPSPPAETAVYMQEANLDWAWMVVQPRLAAAYPHVAAGFMSWGTSFDAYEADDVPLLPLKSAEPPGVREPPELALKVFTLNIQSLKDKHRLIEDQAMAHACDCLLLQETKCDDPFCETHNYMRFASPSGHHWGTAIWIKKSLTLSGQHCRISTSNASLLVAKPRLTAVLLQVSAFSILAVSLHLPHSTKGRDERSALLAELQEILQKYANVSCAVVGVDANARLPVGVHGVTGMLPFGASDEAGEEIVPFLSTNELYVPSTFPDTHVGASHTWRHPRGQLARIDYIWVRARVPLCWEQSWVCDTLDHLTANDDHEAVVWHVSMRSQQGAPPISTLQRPRYDRAKIMSPEGRQYLAAALKRYSPPRWSMHPDVHAAHIQSFLLTVLHKHFMLPTNGPRASYISDAVWSMRQACHRLRQRTRRWNDGFRQFVLYQALHRWAQLSGAFTADASKVILLRELFASAIRISTQAAKKRIRADKQSFLRGVVHSLEGAAPHDVQKALKRFGLGGRSAKKTQRPAPALTDPTTGEHLVGAPALDAAWSSFFGGMEMGEDMSLRALSASCAEAAPPELCEPDPEALPTIQEIEAVFRSVPAGKAFGLDCLPPELFKAAPTQMAQIFCPLYTKASLTCLQPSQWRGGVLFEAWKGKGSAAELANFRSLYISSIAGKSLHKLFRKRLRPVILDTMHEMHCGVAPGRGVTLPTHMIRLLLRKLKRMGRPAAVFMLDTATAYYAIIRDIAVGQISSDLVVHRIFQRFGLGPDDIRSLMDLIQDGGILSSLGVSEHLLHILRDMYSRSWFVTRFCTGERVTVTHLGSRPGSSFADVVFAFVYHRILGRIRSVATSEQLSVPVYHSDTRCPWACVSEPRETCTHVLDTTWADDTAAITTASTPAILLRNACRLSSVVIDTCRSHGLRPNLKRGKSALLLALRGPGCRSVAAAAFRDDRKTLPVSLADGSKVEVPIEAAYVHLGSFLDKDGSFQGEAKRRLAIASKSFDQIRKVALQNPGLDMATRSSLFRSAVGAVFFNLELWTEQEPAWKSLARGYWQLQRRLLARAFCDEHFFRLEDHEVLHLTLQQPLHIQARRKRIGFASSLARTGGREIWAVIQFEEQWGQQLASDFQWLSTWSKGQWPPVTPAAWPLWWHILGRRDWLKAQAKRAARNCWQSELCQAATCSFLRDVHRQRFGRCHTQLHAPPGFCCTICGIGFRTRSGLGAHFKKMHGRLAAYLALSAKHVARTIGHPGAFFNILSILQPAEPKLWLRACSFPLPELASSIGSRSMAWTLLCAHPNDAVPR